VQSDYDGNKLTDEWRRVVAAEAARLGIDFVDLVEDFQKTPRNLKAMFIPPNSMKFGEASGHYTAKGNEVVAEMLHAKLVALPDVASRLATLPAPDAPRR
jgi:hypothetical protein